ncbi:gonadotropin-releasing hormone receptor [Brachyistius frenatus]|uniref:gonadotropin-releasing hormone receptor n=1 Tax=Brachyistius frenatus TaxID=100188 RepID=UPI0037E77AE9
MDDLMVSLLGFRIFVSCIGLVGNVFLILSIIQTKFSRIKSFELFLLGLATANLVEIVIINIYDLVILQTSSTSISTGSCRLLKFISVSGEVASIFFTALISIYRYQKLRDVDKRVNLPIYMDSIRSAWMLIGVCVMLSTLTTLPIFVLNPQDSGKNFTRNSSSCLPDFFQCSKDDCPMLNWIYKYLFILVCYLLPLIIVTITSWLILSVLLSQRRMVTPVVSVSGSNQLGRKTRNPKLQRSTLAVLAAMALFQVDWTLYLIFQWIFSTTDFPMWVEIELFISTSYTSISPYVYGVGNNLFSFKNFKKK